MKKITAMLLALVLILSLAACSGSVQPTPNTNTSEPSQNNSSSGSNESNAPEQGDDQSAAQGVEQLENGISKTTAPWYRGEMNVYTPANANTMAKKDPETLYIGSGNQIIGCDPLNSQDEYPWSKNVYETLITRNWSTGETEPLLATEWGYDDEGNYHITLRENVKFHDGTVLDCDDVFFTLERNAKSTSSNVYDACSMIDFEASYAEDSTHMVLVFKEPVSSFESALQTGFLGILSKEFFEEHGDDYDFFEADAGTGAYKVIETVSGLSQKFERFEDYWGDAPEMKYVQCILYKDYTTGGIDYTNGDLDLLLSINNYDTAMRFFYGELDGTVCYQLPINRGTVLYMANLGGACTDENVRRAVAHAIDYETLAYGVFQGDELGSLGQSVIIPGSKFAIDPGLYEYNPELAAEYLAKAGYGADNPLKMTIETSDNAQNQQICEIIQYYCSQVGIDLECIFEKSSAMTKALNNTEYQYDLMCYPLQFRSGHPSESLAGRDAYGKDIGSFAFIKGIQDEKLHNLMVEGASCLDDGRAAEVYAEIQQMFYDNVWAIPLTVTKSMVFCRDYIESVQFTDGYSALWKSVKLAG